ncbi:MAG: 16S rRNA (cytidine(1402)-2'-O)-methyltransferase [Burkholderiales bacterium]
MLATPIGNLRDITLRALDVLSAVDLIAAEDTRVTRHLLSHYGLSAKIVSLREHNEAREAARLVTLMQQGQSVALVTDAGTPGVSDPGAVFVGKARSAGVKVWPIPGPSAAVCALSVLGWESTQFLFHGFLPSQRRARTQVLEALKTFPYKLVFYESPHRIVETLRDLADCYGPNRQCAVFRELTKKFEESKIAPLPEILAWLDEHADHRRGEFVLIVEGGQEQSTSHGVPPERVLALLCEKLPTKEAVRLAADITGGKRNELYALALKLKGTTNETSDD